MYFISLTRLRVRSAWFLPAFFIANEQAVRQLRRAPGLVSGIECIDKGWVFWTVTVWQNAEVMKRFRNAGAHQQSMRKLPRWCSEASYAHWESVEKTIPDWDFMHRQLMETGRITKVKHPTAAQPIKAYPPPVWRHSQRKIVPASLR